MNENERKVVVRRMLLLIAVACIIMGLYTFRLIFLQLVNGDSFKAKATNTTDYKFTVTAARGDIVDSTGKHIATTSTGYNVVLNKLQMGDQDLDTMLQQIVELLRKNDEKWLDTLLISEPDAAGNYTFTDSADSASDQKTLADMKETLGLQQYATANDVMEMLVEKNQLESFSLPWQRVLAGIHYEMDRQAFSNVNNFVMAENVSQVTVATIKEHSLTLPGVEIVETSTRSYEQGTVLPHVLGRVGRHPLVCIGINPSTAQPGALDPTLKSVERLANANGFDSWIMFNVYPQRATDPNDMDKTPDRALCDENLRWLQAVLAQTEPTMWAAWGTLIEKRDYLPGLMREMVALTREREIPWVTFGKRSKKGHPHHPLYLRKDSTPEPFDVENYLDTCF